MRLRPLLFSGLVLVAAGLSWPAEAITYYYKIRGGFAGGPMIANSVTIWAGPEQAYFSIVDDRGDRYDLIIPPLTGIPEAPVARFTLPSGRKIAKTEGHRVWYSNREPAGYSHVKCADPIYVNHTLLPPAPMGREPHYHGAKLSGKVMKVLTQSPGSCLHILPQLEGKSRPEIPHDFFEKLVDGIRSF